MRLPSPRWAWPGSRQLSRPLPLLPEPTILFHHFTPICSGDCNLSWTHDTLGDSLESHRHDLKTHGIWHQKSSCYFSYPMNQWHKKAPSGPRTTHSHRSMNAMDVITLEPMEKGSLQNLGSAQHKTPFRVPNDGDFTNWNSFQTWEESLETDCLGLKSCTTTLQLGYIPTMAQIPYI